MSKRAFYVLATLLSVFVIATTALIVVLCLNSCETDRQRVTITERRWSCVTQAYHTYITLQPMFVGKSVIMTPQVHTSIDGTLTAQGVGNGYQCARIELGPGQSERFYPRFNIVLQGATQNFTYETEDVDLASRLTVGRELLVGHDNSGRIVHLYP